MTNFSNPQLDASVVIYSEREAKLSGDGAGFWSNGGGWTVLAGATLFTPEQSRIFGLPLGAHPDACWLLGGEAGRVALISQIKTELRNDGFDVAQAPDGRWYSADEQDREEVMAGEYHTENLAWRDLARARRHVLEDANLEHDGVFTGLASSTSLAQQYRHNSADSATVLLTVEHAGADYELRVCGCGDAAYFEWVDELGDPVGGVFNEVDFDRVGDATLAPTERDGGPSSAAL